jgi:hypothetical protein
LGRSARHGGWALLAVWIIGGGLVAQQVQYPIFTVDHMNEAMKTVGLAFTLTENAVGRKDYPLAKDYLIRSRDQLATTITFWRDRDDAAAVALLRTSLKLLDDLDAAMSVEAVDAAAVERLARDASASCEACHAKYREQDPVTKAYRVRSDLLR